MPETILDVVQGLSKEKRDVLAAQAAADITARNEALRAKPEVTLPTEPVVAKIVETDASEGQVEAKPPEGESKAKPVLKASGLVDEEHGVIMLVGSLADAIDLDGDSVPAELLVKCAHDFCGRDNRAFKANHSEPVGAKLVESVTGVPILASGRRLKAGEHIPKDDPMVSIGLLKAAGEATVWVAGVKPEDPAIVAEAKAGRLQGASWGGFATRSKA